MIQENCESIQRCRISASPEIEPVLDLGRQPLANGLLNSPDEPEETFPLRIGFCKESSLIQLLDTVAKEKLFKNYYWVSGTSESTRRYAEVFYARARAAIGRHGPLRVVEVASNDGTFLKPFLRGGHDALGIDPAENIAAEATRAGIPTWPEFWNRDVAKKVLREKGSADLVFARNVVPHVSDLDGVIGGIREVVAEDGLVFIEFHEAARILNELHYDSIYHEHLCYFSLHSMCFLLERHGLHPFHIEFSPISGGSIVVHASPVQRRTTTEFEEQLASERGCGAESLSAWIEFSERCVRHREATWNLLGGLVGQTIVGFGASARSSTYLNYCGIQSDTIRAVIDNNPIKQGLFTPGSRIPIVSFEHGLALNPDCIAVLAWNFSAEIMRSCRERGFRGTFLVPFPNEPRLFAS